MYGYILLRCITLQALSRRLFVSFHVHQYKNTGDDSKDHSQYPKHKWKAEIVCCTDENVLHVGISWNGYQSKKGYEKIWKEKKLKINLNHI